MYTYFSFQQQFLLLWGCVPFLASLALLSGILFSLMSCYPRPRAEYLHGFVTTVPYHFFHKGEKERPTKDAEISGGKLAFCPGSSHFQAGWSKKKRQCVKSWIVAFGEHEATEQVQ